MRAPAALLAVPLLCGAATGLLVCDAAGPWLALRAAAGALFAWLAGVGFLGCRFHEAVAVSVAAGSALAGVSLGVADGKSAYQTSLRAWVAGAPDSPGEPVLLDAVLREDAAAGESGAVLLLDARRVCTLPDQCASVRGGVRATVGGAAAASLASWRAGRSVRAPIFLREPISYANPGLTHDGRALARRGVSALGSIKSATLVEVTAPGGVAAEPAAAVRAWARAELARHVGQWSPRSAAIAAAILVGDRTGLDTADERRLQAAGTYHVVAISGGNIAILTAIVLVVLHGVRVPRRVAAGLAIAMLLFYAEVAGGGASVSRAVTAAVVYLAGRMLDHRGPPVNALAVAALAAAASSALAVFDPGFILSFGATLGILVLARRLPPSWRQRAREGAGARAPALARGALGLLAATASAELALAPVSATVFSRVTLAGLVLNFAAIPLMTIVQAGAMAALALSAVAPGMAGLCGLAAHVAAAGLVESARLVEVAPWAVRDVTRPRLLLVCAYYAAGIFALASRRLRPTAASLAAALLAVMLWSPRWSGAGVVSPPAAGALRIIFFDVGQGDATLVQCPGGRALLVDAAGASPSFDLGERIVSPALRAAGVWRLDVLAVTHGDLDHLGGAASVLRAFAPPIVWEGVPVPPEPMLRELARLARSTGATWRRVQAGDTERVGDVEVRVLNPPPPDWERQRVRNDDSIVLEVRLGDVSIVLPGDVERAAELAMAPRLAPAPLVVLKAPHHGSATSSTRELLAALRPAAVVVSAGRRNRFGHPAAAVVERYRAAGIPILRTDRDGAIVLETDGQRVEVVTWRGRRLAIERVGR